MHRRLFAFLCLSTLALAGCSSQETNPQATESSGADAAAQQDGQGQVARADAGQASESGTLTASAAGGACGEADCVSLLFTGDFLMHNMLWDQAEADAAAAGNTGLDFTPLISEQRPYLDRADLAVCQMETVVADADGPFSGYPNFNVPPQILTAAAETGWDVCMTASNHSYDQGTEGLERTYRAVEAAGMGVTGTSLTEEEAAQPDIFTTANGARVAIITGTYGLNGYVPEHPWQVDMLDSAAMIAKAARAREEGADLVIANMHAGDEYVHEPSAQQVEVAHALVDSGEFDLIVGQHAHAVQPIEYYKGTWIVYGMGNNLTELSPSYVANNEGIMVNPIFERGEDGTWQVRDFRWVSSTMVDNPAYRYCITSPSRPASHCVDEDYAQQSNARIQQIVESMGAAEAGARQWS
ncbi:CapA family protein [Rothia nasimurium]|uniref:CapA family protein n=1 Tax=Rothia nasimurium TaxID=85336 RepID=UPI002DD63BBB|nr:CapA family protein [Rothia nasimurium]